MNGIFSVLSMENIVIIFTTKFHLNMVMLIVHRVRYIVVHVLYHMHAWYILYVYGTHSMFPIP